MLEPPPAGLSFDSKDQLIGFVQQYAVDHGYATSVRSSKENAVTLKCDRGGIYDDRNRKEGNRITSTRLSGCPWTVTGKLRLMTNKWHLNLTHPIHNHEGSVNMSGHSRARFMSSEKKRTIDNMH